MAALDWYWLLLQRLLLVVAAIASLLALRTFVDGDLRHSVRRRLLLGVPWGTLAVSAFVAGVYLFVQDGLAHPYAPTVIPYRSWSYFYPVGVLVSPFAHASFDHLLGNLIATLTLGTVAEYAWGHYPRERGAQTFTGWRTNPFVRVGAFVAAALLVGVLTGIFALGPSIGFSGVVFALAGFALLRYPIGTLVALLVGDLLSLGYNAIRMPAFTQGGHSTYVTPWWADIAVQGHAFGLFTGALLGALLFDLRDERPSAARVWLGVLLFVVSQGLWAIYLPRGGGQYTLYRAVGVTLAFAVALVVASAARASDAPLVERLDLSSREASFGLVVAIVLALALVAIPFNLFVVADAAVGVNEDNSLSVGDYTVFYAEGVPNQYVSAVDVPAFRGETAVNASGVIVVSPERNIWWEVVPEDRLAHDGTRRIYVGGLGWREAITVNRTAWSAVGNETTYTVHFEHGDRRKLAYVSPSVRAEPTVEGRTVTLVPGEPFALRVESGGRALGSAPIPRENATTSAGNLTFVREEDRVYATTADSRVRVATKG
ncbi:rhomboid family intramembrane serine protease [Halomarina halobia]|uniref:Rhomboid family intramembrane serine protease n=1 Tax=Halomarina halobia TaxID=3033386 RepID=A0ABD6A5J7_9EURY|nr:rhomboid family intramembrane serine protease [Halomarina sp. PSR21]